MRLIVYYWKNDNTYNNYILDGALEALSIIYI